MLIAILVLIFIVSLYLNYKRIKKKRESKNTTSNIQDQTKHLLVEQDDEINQHPSESSEPLVMEMPEKVRLRLVDKYAKRMIGLDQGYEYDIELDLGIKDLFLEEAARLVVNTQQCSTSYIQRCFSIGYNRAGRIVDQLERMGVVSEFRGLTPRQVLVPSEDELNRILTMYVGDIDLKGEDLDNFMFENKHAIDARVAYYLSLKEQEEEIEKERQRQLIEKEKERIKQEILEKKRKKELRKIALQELQEEGIIENVKKREPIPQEIQDIVWNRDGGRCVKCGSRENLEFDHIIPFSKGGSNTARNLQLLCEKCNREKSNNIG